jgi:hypothetical protein
LLLQKGRNLAIDFKEKGDFRQNIWAVSPKKWLVGTILQLSLVKISVVLIYRVQPGYIAVFVFSIFRSQGGEHP